MLACAGRAAAHWQIAQAGARERSIAIRLRGTGHALKQDYPAAAPERARAQALLPRRGAAGVPAQFLLASAWLIMVDRVGEMTECVYVSAGGGRPLVQGLVYSPSFQLPTRFSEQPRMELTPHLSAFTVQDFSYFQGKRLWGERLVQQHHPRLQHSVPGYGVGGIT